MVQNGESEAACSHRTRKKKNEKRQINFEPANEIIIIKCYMYMVRTHCEGDLHEQLTIQHIFLYMLNFQFKSRPGLNDGK